MPEVQQIGFWTRHGDSQPGYVIPDIQRVFPANLTTVYFREGSVEGGDLHILGFCTDINFDSPASAERVRHLSFFDAGRIVEQVLMPENPTLRLSGLTLFQSTFLSRVAGAGGVQDNQWKEIAALTNDDTKFPDQILTPFMLRGLTPTLVEALMWRTDAIPGTPGTRQAIDGSGRVKAKGFLRVYGDCFITGSSKPVSIRGAFVTESITAQPSWVAIEKYDVS